MVRSIILKDFKKIRPKYEINQSDYPELNGEIQYQSYLKKTGEESNPKMRELFKSNINYFMCPPDRLKKRAFFAPDLHVDDVNERYITNTNKSFRGATLQERMGIYEKIAQEVIYEFYNDENYMPDTVCFVTSTGYTAPSPLHKFLSDKSWLKTHALHVYHAGCYGAFPALNIARGQLLSEPLHENQNKRVDILHFEASFIHYDPSLAHPAQLINQSLFGDGAIMYSLSFEESHNHVHNGSMKLLSLYERIVPNSLDVVNFNISDHTFSMQMSKHLPDTVINNIENFVKGLCDKAEIDFEEAKKSAVFALHPGGPKVLDGIVEKLSLQEWQVKNSYWVLENYGNMSSATLPHVLERVALDESLKGKLVIAIGMSPGLTVAGAVLQR